MNTTTFAPLFADAGTVRVQRLAAAGLARLRHLGSALWRGLEAAGRARALRELGMLHGRWEFRDPQESLQVQAASAYLVAEGARRQD